MPGEDAVDGRRQPHLTEEELELIRLRRAGKEESGGSTKARGRRIVVGFIASALVLGGVIRVGQLVLGDDTETKAGPTAVASAPVDTPAPSTGASSSPSAGATTGTDELLGLKEKSYAEVMAFDMTKLYDENAKLTPQEVVDNWYSGFDKAINTEDRAKRKELYRQLYINGDESTDTETLAQYLASLRKNLAHPGIPVVDQKTDKEARDMTTYESKAEVVDVTINQPARGFVAEVTSAYGIASQENIVKLGTGNQNLVWQPTEDSVSFGLIAFQSPDGSWHRSWQWVPDGVIVQ